MSFFIDMGQSPRSRLAEQIGLGAGKFLQQRGEEQQKQKQQSSLAKALFPDQGGEFSNLPLEAQLKIAQLNAQQNIARNQLEQKNDVQQQKMSLLNSILGGRIPTREEIEPNSPQTSFSSQSQMQQPYNKTPEKRQFTDEEITALTAIDPNIGRVVQGMRKEEGRKFESERAYHTQFSKPIGEKVEGIRQSLHSKETALNYARGAIESGDVGALSLNKLADYLPGPIGEALRNSSGLQLITAAKENLLSNMSRISAKGQNIWFEQRLNSMFPQAGRTMEANLTNQEMLESESAMDRAYVNSYDKLVEDDVNKYGYVRSDIGKRAQQASEPMQKEIFDRSVYRMKEIQEKEKGEEKLLKEVGKKVPRGTPLTLAMRLFYKNKYNDINLALKKAKEDGYQVPSFDEYMSYQQRPEEYRETLK
jgi:hypothetical protein